MALRPAATGAGANLAQALRSAHGRPGRAVVLDGYGPLPFRPAAVVHPATEEELADIVAVAHDAKVAVRAVGALHSQAPVPYTDGVCIVLDRYDQVLRIDGTAVTVQAGIRLRTLHRVLADRGLAMPVSGTIAEQTIAGAVSTATHGGSIHRGALSDYVDAVTMVRADGTIVARDRGQASFHGLVVSLGLLGILSTVTLRCVPLFRLQSRSYVRNAAEVFDDFDALQRGHEFVNMLYYPVTDQVEILAIDSAADETSGSQDAGVHAAPPAAAAAPAWLETPLVRRLGLTITKALALVVSRNTALQRAVTRRLVGTHYQARTGRSYEVLAFQDRGEGAARAPGILRDMELAVPYAQAAAALRTLRDHFRATGAFPLLPVHIRTSAASESWLSPAYKQAVCWIEFWQYPPSDAFSERMQSLLEPFRYRFHWGKASRATPAYISAQYERWQDFLALRRQWDPGGTFGNEYLNSYFGPAKTPSDGHERGAAVHSRATAPR